MAHIAIQAKQSDEGMQFKVTIFFLQIFFFGKLALALHADTRAGCDALHRRIPTSTRTRGPSRRASRPRAPIAVFQWALHWVSVGAEWRVVRWLDKQNGTSCSEQ